MKLYIELYRQEFLNDLDNKNHLIDVYKLLDESYILSNTWEIYSYIDSGVKIDIRDLRRVLNFTIMSIKNSILEMFSRSEYESVVYNAYWNIVIHIIDIQVKIIQYTDVVCLITSGV